MALKKTQLLPITTVVGVQTVGIYTAGLTATSVGVGTTSYVKSIIMHNAGAAANHAGLGTARVGVYIYPNTGVTDRVANSGSTGVGQSAYRIAQIDLAPRETSFFETNYPLVMGNWGDTLSVAVDAPDSGGSGIGSMVNFIVNGDTDV